jgi:hypothetical protein
MKNRLLQSNLYIEMDGISGEAAKSTTHIDIM